MTPAVGQSGSRTRPRARLARIADRIGEDPARYLDHPLDERGPGHTTNTLWNLVVARVRGIHELGVVNGWLLAERKLGELALTDAELHERGRDPWPWRQECPRDDVVTLLEDRREVLLHVGNRNLPDRSPAELRELAEQRYEAFVEEHGRRDPEARLPDSASRKLSKLRGGATDDADDEAAVATGGGVE